MPRPAQCIHLSHEIRRSSTQGPESTYAHDAVDEDDVATQGFYLRRAGYHRDLGDKILPKGGWERLEIRDITTQSHQDLPTNRQQMARNDQGVPGVVAFAKIKNGRAWRRIELQYGRCDAGTSLLHQFSCIDPTRKSSFFRVPHLATCYRHDSLPDFRLLNVRSWWRECL